MSFDWQAVLDYVSARMSEPNTWTGLSTALTGLGIAIKPQYWQEIIAGGMFLAGIIQVGTRQYRKGPNPDNAPLPPAGTAPVVTPSNGDAVIADRVTIKGTDVVTPPTGKP